MSLLVAKTSKFGKLPVKLQFGVEESIWRQDDYDKDWQVELNIIPVNSALMKNPLFENSNSGTD